MSNQLMTPEVLAAIDSELADEPDRNGCHHLCWLQALSDAAMRAWLVNPRDAGVLEIVRHIAATASRMMIQFGAPIRDPQLSVVSADDELEKSMPLHFSTIVGA